MNTALKLDRHKHITLLENVYNELNHGLGRGMAGLADDADHVPEAALALGTQKAIEATRKWWAQYVPFLMTLGINVLITWKDSTK